MIVNFLVGLRGVFKMYLSNKNQSKVYYLYYRNTLTGKITRITTKTKIKSEAMNFVSDFKKSLQQKKPILKSIVYLSEVKPELLKYVSDNFTKSTLSIYKNTIRNFELFHSKKPLSLISVKDIEDFKNFRLQSVNKTTVNIDIATLKAIFNLLMKWSYIPDNVITKVSKFKTEENKRHCFTEMEMNLIINNLNDHRFKSLVSLAYYTGCRISEVINIQYRDIDLINRILTISNKDNFNTKSKKIRQIPISDNLYNILNEVMNLDGSEGGNIFKLSDPDKYLFTLKGNFRMNRDYITRKFKKHLRSLNIEGCFHSIRHTFITNLIKAGANINYVKELAGHSDIKTTMNYIHIKTSDLYDTINKLKIN